MTVLGKLRYAFGSVFMFGMAPEYFALWAVWRGFSLFMPSWVYQWGDDKLYSLYQRLVLFFFETCTRVEVVLYGDAEEAFKKKENVLYLANHQSTVDWLVANMVAIRGNSIGHLRYVMKDTLQLIPLYGYYFYAHGCIYVKRGRFSQKKMIDSLQYLTSDKISSWMIIFPEGTRYYPATPKVIEKSEQYARDNNLEVLKYHLVPKAKGTWLTLEHLHNKFDAVYDVTVIYENTIDENGIRQVSPQLAKFLMGGCPKLHIHIRRIPMKDVPLCEEKLKIWLHDLFVEKDRLIAPFFSKNEEERRLAEKKLGGKVDRLNFWSTFSAFLFFSLFSIPFACTSVGQKLYLQIIVYGTLGSYGWLALKAVC